MLEIPEFAKRFYTLHCCEGIAFYPEEEEGSRVLLIREEALRKMDPTMQGKPIKFDTDHITLEDEQFISRAKNKGGLVEGVVVKSFFNEWDGRHWAELMVWDQDALAVIKKGIGVSNTYAMDMGPGGEYHALPYDKECMGGTYGHLLITNSPRYEESKILTPEEFKAYNEKRKEQLALVTNSKESSMAFKLFERKAVDGFKGFEGQEVELPKSKKTVLITNVLNAADEQMAKEESGDMYANMDHKVKLFDNSICNVGELHEKYKAAMEENSRLKNENTEWESAAGGNDDQHRENESEEDKEKREKNEKEEEEKKKKENESKEKEKMENQKRIKEKAERIRNAHLRADASANLDEDEIQPEIKMQRDRVVNHQVAEKK